MEATNKEDILSGITPVAQELYVKSISKDGCIHYTDEFYKAMHTLYQRGNKTYVEVYNELGFNTAILSEARANNAGKRAEQKAATKKMFEKNIANYDSDTTFEEMLNNYVKGEIDRDDLYANMASRLIVLEAMREGIKKKQTETVVVRDYEKVVLNENRREDKSDLYEILELFLASKTAENLDLSKSAYLTIFHCNHNFYGWLNRKEERLQRAAAMKKEEETIKDYMINIVHKLNYVPGARQFHVYLLRDYNKKVDIRRCSRLMDEMNLTATKGGRVKKQPSKKEGTHCHPCAGLDNLVSRDFFKGPRKVILTDITYLYTNEFHNVFYLCVFYDCYTKEALGWSVSKHIKTELVQNAYDNMMKAHGEELNGTEKVYIHSDQGSQYNATSYKEMLTKDGFLQSMSERGNCEDNSPMESFFGRTKAKIQKIIALAKSFDVGKVMVDTYLERYNNEIYQYDLAGLTPSEYYEYVESGIYPLHEYFGVSADDPDKMYTLKELINDRINRRRARNEKERNAYAKRMQEQMNCLNCEPEERVKLDQRILDKKIKKNERLKQLAQARLDLYNSIREKTNNALKFIKGAPASVIELLRNPHNWSNYPQLNYIYEMNGLF